MRTGEITKYSLPSATEESAEKSAEGAVQEMGYNASFPILMKIDGRAAYMSALKDKAGLVKAYAIIDAVDYQTVVTASTIDATIELFRNSAKGNSLSAEPNATLEGAMSEITPVVVDGNTMYYFKADGKVLQVSIEMNSHLPFVKDGAKFKAKIDEHGKISSFELVE